MEHQEKEGYLDKMAKTVIKVKAELPAYQVSN